MFQKKKIKKKDVKHEKDLFKVIGGVGGVWQRFQSGTHQARFWQNQCSSSSLNQSFSRTEAFYSENLDYFCCLFYEDTSCLRKTKCVSFSSVRRMQTCRLTLKRDKSSPALLSNKYNPFSNIIQRIVFFAFYNKNSICIELDSVSVKFDIFSDCNKDKTRVQNKVCWWCVHTRARSPGPRQEKHGSSQVKGHPQFVETFISDNLNKAKTP